MQGTEIKQHMAGIPHNHEPAPIIHAYVDLNLQTLHSAGVISGPPPSQVRPQCSELCTNPQAQAGSVRLYPAASGACLRDLAPDTSSRMVLHCLVCQTDAPESWLQTSVHAGLCLPVLTAHVSCRQQPLLPRCRRLAARLLLHRAAPAGRFRQA